MVSDNATITITAIKAREITSQAAKLRHNIPNDITAAAQMGKNCIDYDFYKVDDKVRATITDELKHLGFKVDLNTDYEPEAKVYTISW